MALGRPVEYDWKALHKEHEASGQTLKDFAEQRNLNYTNCSREFTAIEREETKRLLDRTQRILAKNLPDMADELVALSKDEDKNIKLKAISSAMDRAGLSVQAINLQVNNTANVAIVAHPLFAAEYADQFKNLLGANAVDADTESDS